MKFELSESIVTHADEIEIGHSVQLRFQTIALKVSREGRFIKASRIHATFGSINWADDTVIRLHKKASGYAIFAETNYRPSLFAIVMFFLALFSVVGWVFPVYFYLYGRGLVRDAISDALKRVKDEFDEPELPIQQVTPSDKAPAANHPQTTIVDDSIPDDYLSDSVEVERTDSNSVPVSPAHPDFSKAQALFEEAKTLVGNGQKDLAADVLKTLIKRYPESKFANQARRSLKLQRS